MRKICLMFVAVVLMSACAEDKTVELESLKAQYSELEAKYTALNVDYENLKADYSKLEQRAKEVPVPQNNCCTEAAALRQKMANAKKAVRKLKDDFADFQGGFSLINMIDIDDRIKAVESTLR